MAVTITSAELAAALRLGDSPEELAEVGRLLEFATTAIARYMGDAYDSTPAVIVNEAAVRYCGYLFDRPYAARGTAFADALRNSGAAAALLPYRVHRAGDVGGASTTAAGAGVTEARVAELIEAHRAQANAHHVPPTVPTAPMPATPAEAAGGTSTTIRSWTAKLIRSAIEAVVPAWAREGNTDPIDAAKLVNAPSGGGGPETFGTYDLTATVASSFYGTGLILPTDKTWAHISFGTHTEEVPGPPLTRNTFAPGPWVRVLIQDLIDLPDVVAGGTRNDANAIEDIADAQNFRPLEFGSAANRELMVTIAHLNTGATIEGPIRVMVS